MDWENIIKFTSNILGPNIGNSIAGIMIQDVKDDVATADQGHKLPLLQIKDEKILIVTPEVLSSLITIYIKSSPQFSVDSVILTSPGSIDLFAKALKVYDVWLFPWISC